MLDELNAALEKLSYRYEKADDGARLHIAGCSPILFPRDAGEDAWAWLESKHATGGLHEPATVAAILALRSRFGARIETIVDIGTLYGYFALILQSAFAEASVIAFEMNPRSFRELLRNVEANRPPGGPPLVCVHAGLSDSSAAASKVRIAGYELRESGRWRDWLESLWPRPNKPHKRFASATIDLVTLDAYCATTGTSPDLLKIDTEGYQARILPGAARTIERSRPVVLLEFDKPRKMQHFGTTNREVVRPLFELGYRAYWCAEHRHPAARFEELTLDGMAERHEANALALFLP